MSTFIPRIGITPGDPAGIGPDILIQLAQRAQSAELVAIGDPELLHRRAQLLGLPLSLSTFESNRGLSQVSGTGELSLFRIDAPNIPQPGQGSADSAHYLLQSLAAGIDLCRRKRLDALVTGPINKHYINQGLTT